MRSRAKTGSGSRSIRALPAQGLVAACLAATRAHRELRMRAAARLHCRPSRKPDAFRWSAGGDHTMRPVGRDRAPIPRSGSGECLRLDRPGGQPTVGTARPLASDDRSVRARAGDRASVRTAWHGNGG